MKAGDPEFVALVQRIQRRLGFSGDDVDGEPGAQTMQAVATALEVPIGTPSPSMDLVTVGARIIAEASRYVGLTEIVGNRKWDLLATPGHDPIADELVRVMTAAGWQPGWPYCIAWIEAVLRAVYRGTPLFDRIAEVYSPHCLTTWRKAKALGWTSHEPVPGATGIMQLGDSDQGHAFFVRRRVGNDVLTYEANTGPVAGTPEADREGDGIYPKQHPIVFRVTSGLHLIGFIHPPR